MVLEDGARWGESATPEQWDDMTALLDLGGPRKHYWIRARGHSKTTDTGAATLATMLAGGIRGGDEMYAAAAGKEQAALLARKVRGIAERTPELAAAVEIQQHKIVTPRTAAVLDVISADLATSWGKTPRWLFIDEIANHLATDVAETFVTSLLTSLLKRKDSQCLAATTPSAPEHWAHGLWNVAVESPLWRTSIVKGPAPWQDPAELEDERNRLPDFMWRRLFECEWAAAGDALADDVALAECTRHDGPLVPRPGVAYVVSFDLSVSKDHTAVAVAHVGERDGKRTVVIDRLEAWVPPAGGQVDLADVEAWIGQAARDYGGAMIVGDPYQAVSMIGRLREAGFQVKPVVFSSGANSKRAQMLLRLVRDRQLDLPDDAALRSEFLSLRLAEGATPGVLRLTSDGSSKGHFDRVTAVMLAAEELIARPGGSWRDYCGATTTCTACGRVFMQASRSCPFCRTANPDAPGQQVPLAAAAIAEQPYVPNPGGWASAYLPPDARQCGRCGHVYPGSRPHCPRCAGPRAGTMLPAAFTRALAARPR